MRLFVLLLEGKANLKDTGTITLPPADVMEQAPADLKERFDAIESIDLSGLANLEGRWVCVSSDNSAADGLSIRLVYECVCMYIYICVCLCVC